MRAKSRYKLIQRLVTDRLGAIGSYFPGAEIKGRSLLRSDFAHAEIVGKVRRNTHGRSEARDGLQPAKGTLQEGQRRHESGRVSDMERGQYTCYDSHVMIWRSPAHHVAIHPLLRGPLYHPQIVQ